MRCTSCKQVGLGCVVTACEIASGSRVPLCAAAEELDPDAVLQWSDVSLARKLRIRVVGAVPPASHWNSQESLRVPAPATISALSTNDDAEPEAADWEWRSVFRVLLVFTRVCVRHGLLRVCVRHGLLRVCVRHGLLLVCVRHGLLRVCCSAPFPLEVGEFSVKIRRRLSGVHKPLFDIAETQAGGVVTVEGAQRALCVVLHASLLCAGVACLSSLCCGLFTSDAMWGKPDGRVSPADVCWVDILMEAKDGYTVVTFKPHWSLLPISQRCVLA